MLEWNEQYATGVEQVDEQHKVLFKMVNDFEELVRNKTAQTRFKDALKFLGEYTAKHFNCEEAYMEQVQCPAAAENKKAHAEFLRVFSDFVNRLETEGYSDTIAKELLQTLQKWLIKHICGIDTRLKHCASYS